MSKSLLSQIPPARGEAYAVAASLLGHEVTHRRRRYANNAHQLEVTEELSRIVQNLRRDQLLLERIQREVAKGEKAAAAQKRSETSAAQKNDSRPQKKRKRSGRTR
jgi:hypothetical protein